MKGDVFLVILFTSVLCPFDVKSEIEERFKEDFYNIYKHIAVEAREITNEPVTPDKISYYLFTKDSPQNYTKIDPSRPEPLANSNARIVFIIHGWLESREKQWYQDLKDAFLLRKDEEYSVVQVDWSDPAHQFYTISSWNTRDVGQIIGKFVANLHKNYSIPLKNFLLVGHSLGGQVSGFAGKEVKQLTGQKLSWIVALDPAGPLFISRPEEQRLNENDADVVQVIHTDGGTFGFKPSCGTIDFFPNGGSSQPGCRQIDLLDIKSVAEPVICDHQRSWGYFIEAVLNPGEFLANKCGGWVQFKTNLCDEVKIAMGDLKTKAAGEFYLETNNEKPFATRKDGLGLRDVASALPSSPIKLLI